MKLYLATSCITVITIGFNPITYEVMEEVEFVTLTIVASAPVPSDTSLILNEVTGTATSMR